MKSSDFHLISSPNMNKSRNRKIQKTEIKLKSNSIARNVKKRKKKFHDSIESTMTSAFLQQLVINAGQTDSKKIFARDCWKRERERESEKKEEEEDENWIRLRMRPLFSLRKSISQLDVSWGTFDETERYTYSAWNARCVSRTTFAGSFNPH